MNNKVVKTVSVTEFKATCLSLLNDLEAEGGVVVITRRGKEAGRLLPPRRSRRPLRPPHLKHLFDGPVGDVVTPLDVEWKAMR